MNKERFTCFRNDLAKAIEFVKQGNNIVSVFRRLVEAYQELTNGFVFPELNYTRFKGLRSLFLEYVKENHMFIMDKERFTCFRNDLAKAIDFVKQGNNVDSGFRRLVEAYPELTNNKLFLFLEHVKENHMLNGKDGKSIFNATKLCDILSLVYTTLSCPDEEVKDKSNKDRLVLKTSFNTPIGVHGFSRAECHTVKVVYDVLERRLLTAYPIVS